MIEESIVCLTARASATSQFRQQLIRTKKTIVFAPVEYVTKPGLLMI